MRFLQCRDRRPDISGESCRPGGAGPGPGFRGASKPSHGRLPVVRPAQGSRSASARRRRRAASDANGAAWTARSAASSPSPGRLRKSATAGASDRTIFACLFGLESPCFRAAWFEPQKRLSGRTAGRREAADMAQPRSRRVASRRVARRSCGGSRIQLGADGDTRHEHMFDRRALRRHALVALQDVAFGRGYVCHQSRPR